MDSFQFEAGSWPEESNLEWEERAEKFPGWCVIRFLSPSPGVSGCDFLIILPSSTSLAKSSLGAKWSSLHYFGPVLQ